MKKLLTALKVVVALCLMSVFRCTNGKSTSEIVFDKYAFYTVDGLQLIEEKEEPGFYYKLWTDKAEGITHMCSYNYFEGIEKDTTEMNK